MSWKIAKSELQNITPQSWSRFDHMLFLAIDHVQRSMYPDRNTFDENVSQSGYIQIYARPRDYELANENRL